MADIPVERMRLAVVRTVLTGARISNTYSLFKKLGLPSANTHFAFADEADPSYDPDSVAQTLLDAGVTLRQLVRIVGVDGVGRRNDGAEEQQFAASAVDRALARVYEAAETTQWEKRQLRSFVRTARYHPPQQLLRGPDGWPVDQTDDVDEEDDDHVR